MSIPRSFALLALTLATLTAPARAMERTYFNQLTYKPEDKLNFPSRGTFQIAPGTEVRNFVLGGWPETATVPPPIAPDPLAVVYGVEENHDWANPALLRVDPAGFMWLTNRTVDWSNYFSMGRGPILVSFKEPVCAFGLTIARNAPPNSVAKKPRKAYFEFFGESGEPMGQFEMKPGSLFANDAFQTRNTNPKIAAVMITSDTVFAVLDMIAVPCALMLS